jgi:hypothetical protein
MDTITEEALIIGIRSFCTTDTATTKNIDNLLNILKEYKSIIKQKEERLKKETIMNEAISWITSNKPNKHESTVDYHKRYLEYMMNATTSNNESKHIHITKFNNIVIENINYKVIKSTDNRHHWKPSASN